MEYVTPILNALSRAYLEFYTQNGHPPDYFAMSAKMLKAMIAEAGGFVGVTPWFSECTRFRNVPIIELPYVEGVVVACGDPTRIRMPFVIDSTTQGQEAR